MENEFLKYALQYAQRGFHVFPLKPKTKIPLTPNGFKDATNDIQQIKSWWAQYPNANIGIATGKVSDLFVLDVDGIYPKRFPRYADSVKVITKRGFHIYMSYPKNRAMRSRIRFMGEAVDIKSDGGYIVAPPSIHPEGGRYEFESE